MGRKSANFAEPSVGLALFCVMPRLILNIKEKYMTRNIKSN